MILQRLYAYAQRERLLDEPAFEELPVPFVVLIDADGSYCGVQDRHGEVLLPTKKKGGEPKRVAGKGQTLKIPRPHGNTANQGFARFFVDTLPRVLPVVVEEKDRPKAEASRETFWNQIDLAADETNDPALRAIQAFGRKLSEYEGRIQTDLKDATTTDRVAFEFLPDGGKPLVMREAIRSWYAAYFAQISGDKQAAGPVGVCQVTGEVGPLPTSHPSRFQGIPGGMSVGVSLISFDKPAFGHYGLDGAANAGVGYPAAEGYSRAIDSLLRNKLAHLRIGGTVFLFWTRDPADTGFMSLFDTPAKEGIEKLHRTRRTSPERTIGSIHEGKKRAAEAVDSNQFYMLGLSGNAARAVVRGYLETNLDEVKQNIADWFADLRIADTSKDFVGAVNEMFPLWQLALATAVDTDAVAPDTSERLLHAALAGGPVPESLLVCCLRRLSVPDRDPKRTQFTPARMALIKLVLLRREISVTETLNPDERHPAYICGRLLSVFEQIQFAALGDVNANVVDKFYGTFSAAPALVFSRLCANAQNHLRKMRGEKPGAAFALDRRLGELNVLLGTAPPPQQFGLRDQGRFALGYYHEKAKRLEEIAERKEGKARKAEQLAAQ